MGRLIRYVGFLVFLFNATADVNAVVDKNGSQHELKKPDVSTAKPLIEMIDGKPSLEDVYKTTEGGRSHQMDMIRDLNALAYNLAIKEDNTQEEMDEKLKVTTDIIERLQEQEFDVRAFQGITGSIANVGRIKRFLSSIIGGTKSNQTIIYDTPGVVAFRGTEMHLAFRGTHLRHGWLTNLYDKVVDPLSAGIYALIHFYRLQANMKTLSKGDEKRLRKLVDEVMVKAIAAIEPGYENMAVEASLEMFKYNKNAAKFTKQIDDKDWQDLKANMKALVKAVRPLDGIKIHAGFYEKFISCLPGIQALFLAHYRTLTPDQIVSSVLRVTGHSQGAGLSQVFGALSQLVYIWQAEVLREMGQSSLAAVVEMTSNEEAQRVKIHSLSAPAAVWGKKKNVEALSDYLGAKKLFLVQNVVGDIVTIGPKVSGFAILGTEIFEKSKDYERRLDKKGRLCKTPIYKKVVHSHYGDVSGGFAAEEATDLSKEVLEERLSEVCAR